MDAFSDNNQYISSELLNELTYKFGNSYYLFDKVQCENNFKSLKNSFQKFYTNVKLGYSFKTNYLPVICEIAKDQGAYAEVVSGLEYDLALKIGFHGEEIIFNGPLKEKEELEKAFKNKSVIHFDSYEEIKILKDYLLKNPEETVKCALRCNFDIGEEQISRFGFDAESGEAEEVYKELFALNGCIPIGIHGHFSTHHRSLDSFRVRTLKLVKLAKRIFQHSNLEYIDIGGGFFGEMPKNIKKLFSQKIPSFEEYGETVGEIMDQHFPGHQVKLILEPGASVVANTMSFICKVASVKVIQSKSVVTLTGGVHNVRPTGTTGSVPFDVVHATHERNQINNALIGGYTCMENDIIEDSYNGFLTVGDFLVFDCMGAYNIVFKPPFIKAAPPIIMLKKYEGELVFTLVRNRETLNDIFSSFKF